MLIYNSDTIINFDHVVQFNKYDDVMINFHYSSGSKNWVHFPDKESRDLAFIDILRAYEAGSKTMEMK